MGPFPGQHQRCAVSLCLAMSVSLSARPVPAAPTGPPRTRPLIGSVRRPSHFRRWISTRARKSTGQGRLMRHHRSTFPGEGSPIDARNAMRVLVLPSPNSACRRLSCYPTSITEAGPIRPAIRQTCNRTVKCTRITGSSGFPMRRYHSPKRLVPPLIRASSHCALAAKLRFSTMGTSRPMTRRSRTFASGEVRRGTRTNHAGTS